MITAVFTDGNDYANTCGLWQWDYGQELRIQGLDLPKAVEIHFALKETGSEALIRVGVTSDGVTTVTIPDSMLEGAESTYDYKIFAWIYLADPNTGETIKKIVIPVKSRSKPEAFDSPEDREIFEEAIKAVNGAVNRAEELANDAIEVGEEAKEAAVKAEECLEEAQKLAGQIVENVKNKAVKAVEAEGTEQIGIVAAEGAKQLDEIARVMATIPEDYTQLDQHVQDLDNGLNTKAPAIRLEANVQNGGPTELPMPGESGLQGLTVYGKSTQVTTTGAQLFDAESLKQTNGHFELSNDGRSIDVYSAVSQSGASYSIPIDVFSAWVGKTIYLNGTVTGGNEPSLHILIQYPAENVYITSGKSGVINEGAEKVSVRLVPNNTQENTEEEIKATFMDVMVSLSPITEWEPYTGGLPAPNPNYPQEIESVGEDVGITCVGKNLLNHKNLGSNNVTIKTEDKGRIITVTGSAPFAYAYETLPEDVVALCRGRSIYLHSVIKHDGAIPSFQLAVTKSDGTKKWMQIPPGKTSAIVNVPDNAVKINVELCVNNAEGRLPNNVSVIFSDSMISLLTDDAWEPCKSNSQILPTPNGLPGIPVTSGGNYTDKDGQQWVCDTIEWDRVSGTREYVQRVDRIKPSDLKFSRIMAEEGKNYIKIIYEARDFDTDGTYIERHMPVMCNKFIWGINAIGTCSYKTVSDGGWLGKSNLIFCVDKSMTREEFETEILPTLDILASTKEPIRHQLTADQIKALESLYTFSPTSIISNDQGADMQVIYAADTKTYIDSKIDALSKTILDAIAGGK